MPYWRREDLLKRTLARYAELYQAPAFRVIVADDGSSPPLVLPEYPFPLRVLHLEPKQDAKNPCVPINFGVAAGSAPVVALTNPECYPRDAFLGRMLDKLERDDQYLSAACWSTDTQRWYATSTRKSPGCGPLPPGAALHFFSVLRRALWDRVGGFDEAYRDGQGYEDNDWAWRLHAAGAEMQVLDDCVVEHVGTRTSWPPGGLERNRKLFERKWRS